MKKKKETFKASNGYIIEFAHDPKADKPLTEKEWSKLKRIDGKEVLTPEFVEAWEEMRQTRKRGRPKSAKTKTATKLRIDSDVLEIIRATGPGWQTRINNMLREWVGK